MAAEGLYDYTEWRSCDLESQMNYLASRHAAERDVDRQALIARAMTHLVFEMSSRLEEGSFEDEEPGMQVEQQRDYVEWQACELQVHLGYLAMRRVAEQDGDNRLVLTRELNHVVFELACREIDGIDYED